MKHKDTTPIIVTIYQPDKLKMPTPQRSKCRRVQQNKIRKRKRKKGVLKNA
jgi:hypothetical protein